MGTTVLSAVYLCNIEYTYGGAMGVLRASWQWKALNAAGLLIAAGFLTGWSTNWRMPLRADPVLEAGKWAVRFLLICLAMSPMNTYLGWRRAVSLRKSAGLWAFAFGVVHFALSITDTKFGGTGWFTSFPIADFIVLGLVGLLILTVLAVTSNHWAMKRLGKGWKRLHRLVYGAGIAVVLHALLAATNSKRMFVNDPKAVDEVRLYLVILIILLVVRIPLVRTLIKRLRQLRVLPAQQQAHNDALSK
jgi:methionine sulfoxide reductase heme-binding subunit